MDNETYTKLKNLIKAGIQTKVIDTDLIEIEVMGKKQQARIIKPYGIEIDPPQDGLMYLLLSESGNEDSMLAIPVDIDGLIEPKIIFKDNLKIIFKIGDKEGGDFMARFNELESGFNQLRSDHNNFLVHVHGASGTPPVPPAVPSTASIATAKIENIEVPGL